VKKGRDRSERRREEKRKEKRRGRGWEKGREAVWSRVECRAL